MSGGENRDGEERKGKGVEDKGVIGRSEGRGEDRRRGGKWKETDIHTYKQLLQDWNI